MITIAPSNVYIETRDAVAGRYIHEKVFAFIAVPAQQRGGAVTVAITPLVLDNGELVARTGKLFLKDAVKDERD